jgi:hypothetical protein
LVPSNITLKIPDIKFDLEASFMINQQLNPRCSINLLCMDPSWKKLICFDKVAIVILFMIVIDFAIGVYQRNQAPIAEACKISTF